MKIFESTVKKVGSLSNSNISAYFDGKEVTDSAGQGSLTPPHLMQLNEIRIDNVMRIKCGAPLNDNTEADNDVKYGLKAAQQMEPEDEPEEENFWTAGSDCGKDYLRGTSFLMLSIDVLL